MPISFVLVKDLKIEFSGASSDTSISTTEIEANVNAHFGLFSLHGDAKYSNENRSSDKSKHSFALEVGGPVVFGV